MASERTRVWQLRACAAVLMAACAACGGGDDQGGTGEGLDSGSPIDSATGDTPVVDSATDSKTDAPGETHADAPPGDAPGDAPPGDSVATDAPADSPATDTATTDSTPTEVAADSGLSCDIPAGGGTCNGVFFECDETADCTGQVCCLQLGGGGTIAGSSCKPTCKGGSPRLCRSAAECGLGTPCNTFTCKGDTLDFCSATLPAGC
jgi:hypothetical protein